MIRIRKLRFCSVLLGLLFQSTIADAFSDADGYAIRHGAVRSVIVVDSAVKNYPALLKPSVLDNKEIIFLKPGDDPIESIGKVLYGKKISALHIVSHGSPGQLILANRIIDSRFLQAHRQALGQWSSHLVSNADILLYGCDVAHGEAGQRFVEELAALSFTDVAASNNRTGHRTRNADWTLEIRVGDVRAPVFVSPDAQQIWQGNLAFEELYTTTATGLDEGNGTGGSATYQMRDAATDAYVADWRATILSTTTAVGFRIRAGEDDPRIANAAAGTTTIRWRSFEPATTTPHPANYCINISDMDGSRGETVTVTKADIFSYTLSVPTNIQVTDNGSTLAFRGTTDNDEEADAVRLCLKQLSTWDFAYSQSSGGDSAYSHDVDADFPFIGGVTTNFGYTITESSGSPVLSESGTSVVFEVVLDYAPAGDVVIDFGSGDTGEATVSPASLTFTNANWNVVRTVTVTGVDDALADGAQNTDITAAVNDALSDDVFDPLGDVTVTVTTTDDETAGFTVVESGGDTSVNEPGTTDTFTVSLNAQPGSDVVIDVGSGDTGEATAGPASLTFTNGNWNVAQTVTVTGVNDALIDGTQNTTVTISINDAATDDNFDPLPNQVVTVYTLDDESNIPPTNNLPASQSVTEDDFMLFNGANGNRISIIDNAGENLEITIGVADGALSLSQTTGLTFTNGDGTADATMTVSGTVEDINSALDGLRYDPVADFNGNETLTISSSDEILLSYDLDANLQGNYKFDSGNATGDSGPNGAPNGTLIDNAGFVTDATRGNVLDLDGVDDGFEVPGLFGQPGTFTLAAWANVTGVDTNAADIINIGDNILIRADASTVNNWGDGVSATIFTAPATWSIWQSGQYIVGTGWHHIAFTYDSGTGMGRLYLDSTEVVAMASAAPDWSLIGSTTRIGKHGSAETTADTGGRIDDARIYNRVLSGAEIAELYTSPTQTTDTDTLTIMVTPVNDPPAGTVTIDNTSPQVTDILTASNTLTDIDGLSGVISYQWRRDGVNIGGATGSTYTVASADIGAVITVVASYTDDDGTPESVSSAGTAAVVSSGDFTVTESGGSTAVNESGTTDTFTVVLTAQPASDVVINVGSGDAGEAAVNTASLTFTNGNWNVAQTVTVTGVNDFVIDGTQNTTITVSVNDAASDDNFDPIADKTVTASTADNDAAGFTIIESGGNTAVNESGTSDTFTVVLTAQPSNNVVIDVGSGDTGEATVSPANLTFTNGNWNVAQTVTITGANDFLVDGTQNTTITLSINNAASDNNFDPLADQTVTVSTADNDSAGFTITESGGNTSVSESGATDTFTVVLTAQPDSDVVIDVSSGDTGEATIPPSSLTFTNGNWNVAQTVTVTGVDDTLIDGTQNTAITVSLNDAASDNDFDLLADQIVTASTTDNDSAGFTVAESGGNTSVNESGTADAFTVVLTAQPDSDVVIDINSGDTGEATVSPASLTFTNGNWNVAQTVTVTGVDDALIDGNQNTSVTISINDATSDNNFDPLADQPVTAVTVDNDAAGFTIVESGGSTSVNESGATDTFTVVLTVQPNTDVVIDISSGDAGEATVSPASLTFTNGNWNVAQTVTVTGVNDFIIDGNQNTAITLSVNDAVSDNNFDPLADQPVTTATVDNDASGFTVIESGGNTVVNESGTSDTFTVVLNAQPNSDVVIDVSSGDTGEVTVAPASLTFTAGNWNVAQTVTATGADDALVDGPQNIAVTVSINDAGSDNNFDSIADHTVTATAVDNDAAGFTVIESGGNTAVNESGTTDTFTVVLNVQPASDVVIDISSGDTAEATANPASLTFTNGNWNVAQTVTVTGVNDSLTDGPQNTTITLSVNDAGSDNNFDSVADQAVTATTADNDAAGFTVVESGGGTAVNESGTTDTFTVVLTVQPASDVIIDVGSGDTVEATVSPANLTFTNINWNIAQTVAVTGGNDDLIDGSQNTTITLSINDGGSDDSFDPLADQTVTVATADNDTPGFTLVESGGSTSVDESGTTDSLTVVLDSQPASDVVIDISSGDAAEATVSPASVTFTSGNWNIAQTVTVTGVNDTAIDGTQNTIITLSINDAGSDDSFDPLADQTVTVSTADNDAASFTIIESSGSTSVSETGATDSFTVVLGSQPATDVIIDISSGDTGEATVSPAGITFTNGNWNVAQTVTLTGVDDTLTDGTQNVTVTLSINDASSDDSYDPLPNGFVTVSVVDDETSPDADNDGIPNVIEGLVDTDIDGTPDFQDTDSDNDGIPDNLEETSIPPLTGLDGDADGIDNVIDVDVTGGNDFDFNGVDDAFEPNDADADGAPDYVDVDSDNDRIPDGMETDNIPAPSGNDADGDGIDDALDINSTAGADANGNGVDDRYEPRDSEGDGTPDYLDVDSDNDGIHDSMEGDVLIAGDGDGDGIDDRYDVDVTGGSDADGDGIDDDAATDSDNDGRPDYRELDSDNDGLPDVTEAGLPDVNGDGFIDTATTTLTPLDTDFDGTADFRDPDSDNDTVFDIVAAGYTAYDVNSDGRIDAGFFADPDFDGVATVIDPAPAIFGLLNDGDGDGLPPGLDTDDDNDGIPDAIESPAGVDIDSDGDGVVDRIDKDSDNDGIPDSVEAFYSLDFDTDLDGSIDNFIDANNDGLPDSISATMIPEDSDGDGVMDYLDLDSDDDGLHDLLEFTLSSYSTLDLDGDGRIDAIGDVDGDGFADIVDPDSGVNIVFTVEDTDGDGVPGPRDTDSDNDGFDDGLENGDYNGNGIMDFVESGSGISTSIPGGGGGGSFSPYWICVLLLLRCRVKIRKRE